MENITMNQNQIRQELIKTIQKNPVSYEQLAVEIEINVETLKKFLKFHEDVRIKQLLKIKYWIDKRSLSERTCICK